MLLKTRLLALVITGPLLLGVSACAKKQILQDGANLTPQTKAEGGSKNSAASAQSTDQKAMASSNSPAEQRAGSTATPPPGTAALPETPRMAPDRGLGGASTSGLNRIHFGFDQATLTPDARQTLEKNAKYLMSSKPAGEVRIEGYCDERGTAEYNVALGERRAISARKYLEDLGVDSRRIKVISYGKEMPLDPGHDENAWAANRRDEFVAR